MIVWLASYPRSGNTFIRTLFNQAFGLETWSVYSDSLDIAANQSLADMVGHKSVPEDFDWQNARSDEHIHVIKTHELFSDDYAADKAIVLLRDGRDATVSFYHHQKNFGNKIGMEDIIDGSPLGFSWAQHEKSWREAADQGVEILFLRFEDFVRDPESAISTISDFLAIEASKVHIPTFEELNKLSPNFFRQGKSAAYSDAMNNETQRYFWLVNGQRMEANGYNRDLDDDPAADLRLLHKFATLHLASAESNIQRLMRENALRSEAVHQLSNHIDTLAESADAQTNVCQQLEQRLAALEKQPNNTLWRWLQRVFQRASAADK